MEISQTNYKRRRGCYVIAEIGVNHGGDVELAKRMIVAAGDSGADAVKFQTFTAEALVNRDTPKVRYQESTTSPDESHFEMIKSLELSRDGHVELYDFCRERKIDFISTPYDLDSAKFLGDLGVRIFKVASADIVDLPLNDWLARHAGLSILSTGMATMDEIAEAVELYSGADGELVLLHCVSNYPCSHESLNMKVMDTLKQFGHPVGFSDHSLGACAAIMSIALGARIVEKHFTLDKTLPGPDHAASSTPKEFGELVRAIREAEICLGDAAKAVQDEERQMRSVSRKSIFAARTIEAGARIVEEDLCLKRPGSGLYSRHLKDLLGGTSRRRIDADTMLSLEDVERP